MKKQSLKKLSLQTQTIRELTDELSQVAGGGTTLYSCLPQLTRVGCIPNTAQCATVFCYTQTCSC